MKVLVSSSVVILGALCSVTVTTVNKLNKVHKYRAESILICNLCKSYSALLSVGNASLEDCTDGRGKIFPICQKLQQNQNNVIQTISKKNISIEKFCQQIGACSPESVKETVDLEKAMCPKMIEKINSGNYGWTAGVNEIFQNSTLNDVKKLLGTIVDSDYVYQNPLKQEVLDLEEDDKDINTDLPTNFDAREKWSQCKDVIGRVRDQSSCGSCWAFGTTEALNDRRCIKNGDHTVLSAADTMECCTSFGCGFSQGCNGGQPGAAWNWFTRVGVVTGADYDDRGKTDTCLPYPFAPCAHHVKSPSYPDCPTPEYKTPSCRRFCTNHGYDKDYFNDKIKASKSYDVEGVEEIMKDIYTYGTVTAGFTVYSDFPAYKSGVYKHSKSSKALGGHAVKIIGWGVEGNEPYWLVVNSWNDTWGDKGLFKILRGQNECGIESSINAGHA